MRMKTTRRPSVRILAVFIATTFAAHLGFAGEADEGDWPQFRGPGANGLASGDATPTTWNVPEGMGVKWKTPIPGLGHSSPIVWGDRLYVTTAVSGKDNDVKVGLYGNVDSVEDDSIHAWRLFCLDKATGAVVFEKTVVETVPRVKRHTKASHANSTPATDGKRVVAFLGSEGLFCFDMDGQLLWKKDMGPLDAGWYMMGKPQWGFGSSPVIHRDVVIVQCDVQEGSFIAALNLETGEELWRTPRDEVPTWGSPTLAPRGDGFQVLVNGYKHIGGYDFQYGRELWKMTGGGDIPVPTPIVHGGLVFITNAHGKMQPMYAVLLDASGDISLAPDQTSNEHVAWMDPRSGAYMQTPIVLGDLLFTCSDSGALTCYRAATGEKVYKERLGEGRTGFTASAVSDGNFLYYTSETGDVYVVKPDPSFEIVSINPLGEVCMATPAISDGVLYFRTQSHVIAIGK